MFYLLLFPSSSQVARPEHTCDCTTLQALVVRCVNPQGTMEAKSTMDSGEVSINLWHGAINVFEREKLGRVHSGEEGFSWALFTHSLARLDGLYLWCTCPSGAIYSCTQWQCWRQVLGQPLNEASPLQLSICPRHFLNFANFSLGVITWNGTPSPYAGLHFGFVCIHVELQFKRTQQNDSFLPSSTLWKWKSDSFPCFTVTSKQVVSMNCI